MAEDDIKSKDESQLWTRASRSIAGFLTKTSRTITGFPKTSSEKIEQGTKRDQDLLELKGLMAEIKSTLSRGKMPSSATISQLAALAQKYPLDPEFTKALDKALNDIQEAAIKVASASGIVMVGSYSEQEYQALLKAEEAYFESKEVKARRSVLDKFNNGALINDNDPTGNSMTTKGYTDTINLTNSAEDTKQRKAQAEFIYSDAKRLQEKQVSDVPLDSVDMQRLVQIKEHGKELVDIEILKAHHDKLNIRNEPASEDLTRRIGNQVLESARAAQAEIKEAFIGQEHKLVALVAHKPEAFHEHAKSGNIDKLKEDAAAADIMHRAKETERMADRAEGGVGVEKENIAVDEEAAKAAQKAARAAKKKSLNIVNIVVSEASSIDPLPNSLPNLKDRNQQSRE